MENFWIFNFLSMIIIFQINIRILHHRNAASFNHEIKQSGLEEIMLINE